MELSIILLESEDYSKLRERVGIVKYDLDLDELFENNQTIFETKKYGDILVTYSFNGNVHEIGSRKEGKGIFGYKCCYDKELIPDTVCDSINDFLNDVDIYGDTYFKD